MPTRPPRTSRARPATAPPSSMRTASRVAADVAGAVVVAGGGGGRGVRGGRAAYQSAVSRERYGGGRGAGGLNRYPDVSGRSQVQQDRPPRDDRNYQRGGDRPAPRTQAPSAPRSSGPNEPW